MAGSGLDSGSRFPLHEVSAEEMCLFPVQSVLGTSNVSSHFPVSSVRSEALPRPGSSAFAQVRLLPSPQVPPRSLPQSWRYTVPPGRWTGGGRAKGEKGRTDE